MNAIAIWSLVMWIVSLTAKDNKDLYIKTVASYLGIWFVKGVMEVMERF